MTDTSYGVWNQRPPFEAFPGPGGSEEDALAVVLVEQELEHQGVVRRVLDSDRLVRVHFAEDEIVKLEDVGPGLDCHLEELLVELQCELRVFTERVRAR
jgi:hypothetical protein